MARSIMGTIGLAVTLALAAPIALYGVEQLLGGDSVVGLAALGVAALMILVEEFLTTPTDIPGKVAEATVGRIVEEPSDERD
ncbi:hypothetical protein [Halosegnis sp.]|uniref:DUF7533 family protein n=1 Tax=Halosegnis sp. TaxID=2864959 RepID=UPI0035D4E2FC